MNILLATSEAVPFAKTGGLGDVCGALPVELARLGHNTAVILPYYRKARYCGQPIEPLGIDFIVPIGSKTVTGHLLAGKLPRSDVPVYLVRQDQYFDREELYGEDGQDYDDNCERFVFFSRAVMETIRLLELDVDVIHANDWQTGLVPAYLTTEYGGLPRYKSIACLFALHNMAYQGRFWHWDMLLTGLDWKYFNWHQMEYHGKLNLLKTGLVFADAINAVSPRYAQEIQTAQFGCGLEGVLRQRRDILTGILNGVDYGVWDPAVDPVLAANYDCDSVATGKPKCKAALQDELGLPRRPDTPLVGMIGRLDRQKGFDLVADVMPEWVETTDLEWVILGTGDPDYEARFRALAERFPKKVAARLEFSDDLAHKIEAGADIFLMPSRYEPCGLNQMYSLKYGTVPVVRDTGGLADTIVDASDQTLAEGTANGFSFQEDNCQALDETLQRARDAYRRPDVWRQLVRTGMQQDWSWARSARQYVELYQQITARKN
ncbi:MAG: starch synthase [Planctomycetes bacterium RBG_16_64_12]|nr:MAG: starch synthase [Planctomycetes bacterium RBG_16_64_12]